jgi:hypothetical protein
MGCLAGSPRATRSGGFARSCNALAGVAPASTAPAGPRKRSNRAFYDAAEGRRAKEARAEFHSADAGVAR